MDDLSKEIIELQGSSSDNDVFIDVNE